MSADRLRQAAQKIRDTADAATDGQWVYFPGNDIGALPNVRTRRDGNIQEGVVYAVRRRPDAAHIALWSPPVALAVADWLEREAADVEGGYWRHDDTAAMDVADLILGGAE